MRAEEVERLLGPAGGKAMKWLVSRISSQALSTGQIALIRGHSSVMAWPGPSIETPSS